MNVVRCAVLGLGRLGKRHAENLAMRIPGAKLNAVMDVVPELAEQVARDLNVPFWATNADQILERDDVDAVFVVTPTDTHAALAKRVVQRGKSLFLEKPITLDLEEAERTTVFIEQSGALCQLGFMRRFDPAYVEAKRQIVAGAIGQPLYFKGVSRDPSAPPMTYVATSGGIFADQSIHDYDIARFLIGDDVRAVAAMGSVLYSKEVAKYNDVDQAVTYLRFDGGAAGDVEACRNAFYGYDIRTEVIGTEGTVVVSGLRSNSVTLLTKQGGQYGIVPGFIERFAQAYIDEVVAFIECVRDGRQPSVSAVDGYQALAIATAARRSYEQGAETDVPRYMEVGHGDRA